MKSREVVWWKNQRLTISLDSSFKASKEFFKSVLEPHKPSVLKVTLAAHFNIFIFLYNTNKDKKAMYTMSRKFVQI